MNITKNDIPVRIRRPAPWLGSCPTSGRSAGTVGGYFSMAEGPTLAPLLEGLKTTCATRRHLGYG
ncbi:MAG: hypothetical protein R2716_10345 [Microthrixaceae bacterium]